MDMNSAEVKFAQSLASNQLTVREKAVKNMGKYFKRISVSTNTLTEEGMLKLWKGIFYYFWNCDKPLFQEDRADVLSNYIHVFQSVDYSLLYLDTFLQTMAREWFTIDRYRLEKFMLLIRKFLHESFALLKNKEWEIKWIKSFRRVLKKTVLNTVAESAPLGLKLHIAEIYMEELAKVGYEELTPELVQAFLIPYCNILSTSDESTLITTISKEVFIFLINQDADDNTFGDFPVLSFDAEAIQNLLMKYASKPNVKRKNMKKIYDIVKQFEDFKNGIGSDERLFVGQGSCHKLRKREIEKAALSLVEEELKDKEENLARKKKRSKNIVDL